MKTILQVTELGEVFDGPHGIERLCYGRFKADMSPGEGFWVVEHTAKKFSTKLLMEAQKAEGLDWDGPYATLPEARAAMSGKELKTPRGLDGLSHRKLLAEAKTRGIKVQDGMSTEEVLVLCRVGGAA